MRVKKYDLEKDNPAPTAVDETADNSPLCPAEVAPFEPCGKPMRRYRNGDTYCPEHGLMH